MIERGVGFALQLFSYKRRESLFVVDSARCAGDDESWIGNQAAASLGRGVTPVCIEQACVLVTRRVSEEEKVRTSENALADQDPPHKWPTTDPSLTLRI